MRKSIHRTLLGVLITMLCAVCMATAFIGFSKNTVQAGEILTFELDDGASIRLTDPSGIRFSTKVNKTYLQSLEDGYEFGTIVIPTDLKGDNPITINTPNAEIIKQTVWGEDKDGYAVFNAVLGYIPSTEYGRALSAISYVKIGDVYTYSEVSTTRSLGQVASLAIKDGETNPLLKTFVEGAVSEGIALNQTKAQLKKDEQKGEQISLSVNGGFVADWTSSDEKVATVKDGVVTAVGGGIVDITAKVGETQTAICKVAVMEDFSAPYGTLQETYQQRDADGKLNYDATVQGLNFGQFQDSSDTTFADDIYTIKNLKSNSGFRFYSNEFNGLNNKQVVSVTMTYKYTLPNAENYSSKGQSEYKELMTTDTTGAVVRYPLEPNTADYTTLTFNAVITNSSEDYIYLNGIKDKAIGASAPTGVINTLKANIFEGSNKNNIAFAITIPTDATNSGTMIEIKNISLTPKFTMANTETTISAGSKVNVATVLGISDDIGTMEYSVKDKDGKNVALTNGEFTAGAIGNFYKVEAKVTKDNLSSETKLCYLVVEGTYLNSLQNEDINNFVSNNWYPNQIRPTCIRSEVVSDNGDKHFSFKVDEGNYGVTFNLPLEEKNGVNIIKGKTYKVTFRCWTNEELKGTDKLVLSCDSPLYNAVGELSASQKDTTFSMYFVSNGGRLATFYIKEAMEDHITFNIDDIMLEEVTFISTDGGTVEQYSDSTIITNTKGWDSLRVTTQALADYEAGDTVYVTMKYKTKLAKASDQNQLRVGIGATNTSVDTYTFVTNSNDWTTLTFRATVYTAEKDDYGINAITGGQYKHIKLAYLSPIGNQLIVDSVAISYFYVKGIRSNTGSVAQDGHFIATTTGGDSDYRIYHKDLIGKSVGDAVKVRITYNVKNGNIGWNRTPNASGTMGSAGTMPTGNNQVFEFTGYVSTSLVSFAQKIVMAGDEAPNIFLCFALDAGATFEILNVEILPNT